MSVIEKIITIPMILNLYDNNMVAGIGGSYTINGNVVNATHNTTETTGNDLTPEYVTFHSRRMLDNYYPQLVHSQFGIHTTVPQRNGSVVEMRGLDPYPDATTPLEEGITPKGNTMNVRKVLIYIHQYGTFTPVTDWLGFVSLDNLRILDSENLGKQAGNTIDKIDAEMLNTGKNVIYADTVTGTGDSETKTAVTSRYGISSKSKFTVDTALKAARALKVQNAPTINGSYVAIVHPDSEYDVISSKGFRELVTYTNAVQRVFEGEIGKIGSVRFVTSTNAKIWTASEVKAQATADGVSTTGNVDVYSTLVLGENAYAVAEIEGLGMQTIIKELGSAGSADPLNQRGTQGWKTSHGVGIICETNMVRVEHSSTFGVAA